MNGKRVIVVGASSGIGAEVSRMLTAAECKVVRVARSAMASTDPGSVIQHDVTDFASVPGAFEQAVAYLGGLDAIYYAAGVMPIVAPAEFNFEKDRQMIDDN